MVLPNIARFHRKFPLGVPGLKRKMLGAQREREALVGQSSRVVVLLWVVVVVVVDDAGAFMKR